MSFASRMREIDPKYGTQKHQFDFLARLEHAQAVAPCNETHEHNAKCYPLDALRAVRS